MKNTFLAPFPPLSFIVFKYFCFCFMCTQVYALCLQEGVRYSGAGVTDMWVLGTELQPTGPLLYSYSSVCLGSSIICLFPKQSNWISQIYHHDHSRNLLDWMRQYFTHANKGFDKFLGKWPMLTAASSRSLGGSGILTQWLSEKNETPIHPKVRSTLGKVWEKKIE